MSETKNHIHIEKLSGWALQLGARASDTAFLQRLAVASRSNRQLYYAALANLQGYSCLTVGMTIAEASCPILQARLDHCVELIRHAKPRTVIEQLYGGCPPGFLGALRRTVNRSQPRVFYTKLFEVFSEHRYRAHARALAHVDRLDVDTIFAMLSLPRELLLPTVVRQIRRPEKANEIATAVRLLASAHPGFSDPRNLRKAVSAGRSVKAVLVQALTRIDRFVPAPLNLSGLGLEPVHSTQLMRARSREYGNCLGQAFMIAAFLGGDRYVYEDRPARLLIEIGRTKDGWCFLSCNSPGRRPIDSNIAEAVEQKLADVGIRYPKLQLLQSEFAVFERLEDGCAIEQIADADSLFAHLQNEQMAA